MVQEPSFILDEEGKYLCLDTARIITGDNLWLLLSIMNSKLFFYSVKTFYGGGGLGETGIRMKHTYFDKFPMPKLSNEEKRAIRLLVENPTLSNVGEIDNIIYSVFKLNDAEINLINSLQ